MGQPHTRTLAITEPVGPWVPRSTHAHPAPHTHIRIHAKAHRIMHMHTAITRYMDSYMYALKTSSTDTLLQVACAVKPAL